MTDLLDAKEIARRTALSLKAVYVFAQQGKLGSPVTRYGKMYFRRDAVESFFSQSFGADPPQPSTSSKTNINAAVLNAPLTHRDFLSVANAATEARDREWSGYLFSKNIHVEGPPPSRFNEAALKLQTFFTITQVRELITRAVQARNEDWSIWADDPLQRMQQPNGPGPFDWTELEPANK